VSYLQRRVQAEYRKETKDIDIAAIRQIAAEPEIYYLQKAIPTTKINAACNYGDGWLAKLLEPLVEGLLGILCFDLGVNLDDLVVRARNRDDFASMLYRKELVRKDDPLMQLTHWLSYGKRKEEFHQQLFLYPEYETLKSSLGNYSRHMLYDCVKKGPCPLYRSFFVDNIAKYLFKAYCFKTHLELWELKRFLFKEPVWWRISPGQPDYFNGLPSPAERRIVLEAFRKRLPEGRGRHKLPGSRPKYYGKRKARSRAYKARLKYHRDKREKAKQKEEENS
jgi:hypothetical protein